MPRGHTDLGSAQLLTPLTVTHAFSDRAEGHLSDKAMPRALRM